MNLSQLTQALAYSNTVSIDTRTLQKGSLYIALRGERFDGHDFIEEAERAGAVAAVVSRKVDANIPLIQVEDTHEALKQLAGLHREKIRCPIAAVTGSCGKTTTKVLLANIMQQVGETLWNPSSFNNDIGVPLTLLQLRDSHRYAVQEIGANHAGEIAELTHLVKPRVAAITNAGPAHLEGFGSLEGVACAKGEIFQGLGDDGIAVINNDDPFVDFWKKLVGNRRIITFGTEYQSDVMATNIQFNEQGCPHFHLQTPMGHVDIHLPLMGEHNVKNALTAAACAIALEIPLEAIKKGLESAKSESKRLIEKVGKQGAKIIDDSYNANPSSVSAALSLLSKRPGKKVLVLGDMLELGEESEQFHHQVGVLAEQNGIDRLYCFGEHTQQTVEAFGENAQHFPDKKALVDALLEYIDQDVTVLVKGSRSMQMEQVAEALSKEK